MRKNTSLIRKRERAASPVHLRHTSAVGSLLAFPVKEIAASPVHLRHTSAVGNLPMFPEEEIARI